jgi:hypothetical protein
MVLTSPPGAIRQYLNIILEKIIVHGHNIEIVGKTAGVMGILSMQNEEDEQGVTKVRIYRNEWQPVMGCTYNPLHVFCYSHNLHVKNILYFHSEQIGEWLAELLELGVFKSQRDMAQEFGLHHSRIGQFLALLKLPVKERRRYKKDDEVREYQLRASRCG